MTNADIRDAALALGFTHIAFTDASPFPAWAQAQHPPYLRLESDPKQVMPEARSIIVLALCYEPYAPAPAGYADVSAYYVVSNASYSMAHKLAGMIGEMGARAVASPALPEKPACVRSGLGAYGANQQVLIDGGALPCVLQTILTDVPLNTVNEDEAARSTACAPCGACAAACPTTALDNGYERNACIRDYMFTGHAVPEGVRPYMGKRLLGCDACLAACARKAPTGRMPAPLLDALNIDVLIDPRALRDRLPVLSGFIGSNYARAHRVLAHAVIAAANEGDKRRLPALKALMEHEDAIVREHARWGVGRLAIND